jgi:hypothetical protein
LIKILGNKGRIILFSDFFPLLRVMPSILKTAALGRDVLQYRQGRKRNGLLLAQSRTGTAAYHAAERFGNPCFIILGIPGVYSLAAEVKAFFATKAFVQVDRRIPGYVLPGDSLPGSVFTHDF